VYRNKVCSLVSLTKAFKIILLCQAPLLSQDYHNSDVPTVTSDMGAANMGMWKSFGIKASKYDKIKNLCTHPNDKSQNLYFFHDFVHAYKNLNQGLLNNKIIIILNEIVKMYNLPNNIVKASDIKDLCTAQETLSFRLSLTPKLNIKYFNTKNHFQKMRVGSVTNILNHSVATALDFLGNSTDNYGFIQHGLLV